MGQWIFIPAAAIYATVTVALWRPMARYFLSPQVSIKGGWGEFCGFIIFTTACTALWAIWLPLVAVKRLLKADDAQALLAHMVGESRAHKAQRMAERVAELEKELELR